MHSLQFMNLRASCIYGSFWRNLKRLSCVNSLLLMALLNLVATPILAENAATGNEKSAIAVKGAGDVKESTSLLGKSRQWLFNNGLSCLDKADVACAKAALLSMPGGIQSPEARLLDAYIALAETDLDRALVKLVPLLSDVHLADPLRSHLHALLAEIYGEIGETGQSVEHRVRAMALLPHARPSSIFSEQAPQADGRAAEDAIQLPSPAEMQQKLWEQLRAMDDASLIEMRGLIADTDVHGWIDLALLAGKTPVRAPELLQWQSVYPEHMAKAFAPSLLTTTSNVAQETSAQMQSENAVPPSERAIANQAQTPVALVLPFSSEPLYPVADAIQRGLSAAQQITSQALALDIRVYASDAQADTVSALYQRAVSEGAALVIGPLTRAEVSALAKLPLQVPTLALNRPETEISTTNNYYSFGLQADQETQQVVTLARAAGMQNAVIMMTDSTLSARVAQAFHTAWTAEGGQVQAQFVLTPDQDMTRLQSDLSKVRTDMIFLSVDPDTARNVRPFLDIGIPTFAISQIYNGIAQDQENAVLNAIRFVDMPWLLEPERADFAPYRKAGEELPPGDMQRWFALGVDAYHLAQALLQGKTTNLRMQGLTGMIRLENGRFTRELLVGRFSAKGVELERMP